MGRAGRNWESHRVPLREGKEDSLISRVEHHAPMGGASLRQSQYHEKPPSPLKSVTPPYENRVARY